MRKISKIPNIDSIFSVSGSRKKTVYTPVFNGSSVVLRASGTVDVQDSINAYAPYTDIRYMLHRLKLGDSSVLSSGSPLFGDFTSMPTDPVMALNLMCDVQRRFAELPESVRMANNNDWRVYFTGLFHNSVGNSSNSACPDSPSVEPLIPKDSIKE